MKKLKNLIVFALLLGGLPYLLGGCSAVTIEDDSPPEAQYAEGERLLKKGRYLEAGERFRILKNRYPYSAYASLAALRVGDTYYEQESFIEAAAAYKVFTELYPKHPQTDYAVFRMGESYYKQVPEDIDRDLSAAGEGITAFQRLQKESPNSEYTARAQKYETELKERLSAREEYVGDFYFRHDDFKAAAGRYRYLLKDYGELDKKRSEKALYRLALAYEKIGDKERASEALDRLRADYPNSQYSKDAADLEKVLRP